MSDLKPKKIYVNIDGKDRQISFNMNVLEKISDELKTKEENETEYIDGIVNFFEDIASEKPKKQFNAVRKVLTIMFNDTIEFDNFVNKKNEELLPCSYVGRFINTKNIAYCVEKILEAYKEDFPQVEENTPSNSEQ